MDQTRDFVIFAYAQMALIIGITIPHRKGGNQKRSWQSANADRKSLETVFPIAICRQSGDKWQSKTLFLLIFELRSSIVSTCSIVAYPVWIQHKVTKTENHALLSDIDSESR